MSRASNLLFSNSKFSDYQRSKRDELKKEISGLTSTELENSTDSLVLILTSKYAPSTIKLYEQDTEDVGQIEKTKRINRGNSLPGLPRRGNKITRTMHRLKLKVPYTGERRLLMKQPRRYNHAPPSYDELTDTHIVHYVDYRVEGRESDKIKESIDSDISKWQDKLEEWVDWLNTDIRKMQEKFENLIRSQIEDQRENVSAKNEALSNLGISTGSVDEGFVEPEKKKDLQLPDLNGGTEERKRIRDKTFVDVLDIIDSMRVNVERSKDRVRELDEESLRDIFLGAIDSHYGSATAESFNRGGKTDILLRHQSVNLFVAECKFWQGKSHFQDAVNQLLGNVAPDDGHAALLVFSDREDVVQVRNRVEETIESHGRFQASLSRIQDHDVYRFTGSSGTEVKVGIKVVDLAA